MKSTLTLTKKDIAVVLVCAFFLLINLGAIGARGNEHAKRILCASRLAKWGQAIFMHLAENDDDLMFIPRRWNEGPFPHYMAQVKDYDIPIPSPLDQDAEPGEWNLFEINPYIGAFSESYDPFGNPADCGVTRLVACPSTDSEFRVEWCTLNCEEEWNFTEPGYSYWVIGQMPHLPDTGQPDHGSDGEAGDHIWQDLTIDTLSPGRLVMSDIMAIDNWGGVGSPYSYNHGRTGWSWFGFGSSGRYDPEPDATGRNQLFGDGAVKWRAIPAQYEDNLPNTEDVGFTEDRWNGPGSGWMNVWDTSYY